MKLPKLFIPDKDLEYKFKEYSEKENLKERVMNYVETIIRLETSKVNQISIDDIVTLHRS